MNENEWDKLVSEVLSDPVACKAYLERNDERLGELERRLEGWKVEAEAHRETILHAAEAAGWKDLRQENGDLHLPSVEDIITVVTERLRTALQEAAVFVEHSAASAITSKHSDNALDWLASTAELRGKGKSENDE